MKQFKCGSLIGLLLAVIVVLAGCSKSEPTPPSTPPPSVNVPPPPTIKPPPPPQVAVPGAPPASIPAPPPSMTAPADPYAKVLAAFASSDADTKSAVNNAVAAMKAGRYADAVTLLQKLLADGKLTAEQLPMIKDLLVQAQKQVVSGAAEKAASDVQKAVPEVPKSLPLGQ